jgi:hypothetical protein
VMRKRNKGGNIRKRRKKLRKKNTHKNEAK